jgi:hypothetical protein
MGPDANPSTYIETTKVPNSIFVLRNSAMRLGTPGANIARNGISNCDNARLSCYLQEARGVTRQMPLTSPTLMTFNVLLQFNGSAGSSGPSHDTMLGSCGSPSVVVVFPASFSMSTIGAALARSLLLCDPSDDFRRTPNCLLSFASSSLLWNACPSWSSLVVKVSLS